MKLVVVIFINLISCFARGSIGTDYKSGTNNNYVFRHADVANYYMSKSILSKTKHGLFQPKPRKEIEPAINVYEFEERDVFHLVCGAPNGTAHWTVLRGDTLLYNSKHVNTNLHLVMTLDRFDDKITATCLVNDPMNVTTETDMQFMLKRNVSLEPLDVNELHVKEGEEFPVACRGLTAFYSRWPGQGRPVGFNAQILTKNGTLTDVVTDGYNGTVLQCIRVHYTNNILITHETWRVFVEPKNVTEASNQNLVNTNNRSTLNGTRVVVEPKNATEASNQNLVNTDNRFILNGTIIALAVSAFMNVVVLTLYVCYKTKHRKATAGRNLRTGNGYAIYENSNNVENIYYNNTPRLYYDSL